MTNSPDFWCNKHVLLTGHTGFKGSWMALWLQRLGARVTGIALPPNTTPNLFELGKVEDGMESHFCDIRDAESLLQLIHAARPEVVFHFAAQPLVRSSYRNPINTFSSNFMGTVHVLDTLRGLNSVRSVVMITTDKVYRNNEWAWPYREDDALGGYDPYSASKAACEIAIASYRDSFLAQQGVAVASARAGNVIGGGDWSEERLIPDAIRSWQTNRVLEIRRPHAIRPWQHVLEPLFGYLKLAEKLWSNPELACAFNFGPTTKEAATVAEVIELARIAYGSGEVIYDYSADPLHEAGALSLEISKARTVLGITPKWDLSESLARTMNWYRAQHGGADARTLCEREIGVYEGTV